MNLEIFFSKYSKIALGFSGGVDSSYLLYAGKKFGANIKPYFIKTVFQPNFELIDAKKLASDVGIDLSVIEIDVLKNKNILKNDSKRCYYCKSTLFGVLKKSALKDGYNVIIDGTNFSDDINDRPGMKAISELNVLSPLRECQLTKQEIRKLSKDANLFTWNKPSYSCLATRILKNDIITKQKLNKIEKAEDILFSFGFSDFRVRLIDNIGKIELPKDQMTKLIMNSEDLLKNLSFLNDVVLDLKPRS